MFWNRKGKEDSDMAGKDGKGTPPGAGGGGELQLPEGMVAVKKEDWDKMSAGLETLGRKLDVFEQAVTLSRAPAAAAVAPGPSVDEQVAAIETEIEALEEQIDKAISEEKPTAALRKKVHTLVEKKSDIRSAVRLADIEGRGTALFEQLATNVLTPQMPMLKYAVVKKAYDETVAQMTPQMRANPAALRSAYNLALGANMAEVMSLQAEETARAAAAAGGGVQVPRASGSPTGRQLTRGGGAEEETPEDHFGTDAVIALQSVNRSFDRVAKAFGFTDAKQMTEFDARADEYELDPKGFKYGVVGGGA